MNEVGANTVIVVPTRKLVEAEHELGYLGRRLINDKFFNAKAKRVIEHELKEHRFE